MAGKAAKVPPLLILDLCLNSNSSSSCGVADSLLVRGSACETITNEKRKRRPSLVDALDDAAPAVNSSLMRLEVARSYWSSFCRVLGSPTVFSLGLRRPSPYQSNSFLLFWAHIFVCSSGFTSKTARSLDIQSSRNSTT